MRYTGKIYEQRKEEKLYMCNSANVLSVNIVSSDVGFPINVYGTVIARDSLDCKCIHLFRRCRDDCQLIDSEDQSLILTGPNRGLVLYDVIYFEIDLKIKDDQGQKDKELSKGLLTLNGILSEQKVQIRVESTTLHSRLSSVQVAYAFVKRAVEATFAIEVLHGDFYGDITACTTSIQNSIVLHDSKAAGVMTADGNGLIQLLRRVVAVRLDEMLILNIVARAGDGETDCSTRTIHFTPRVNGGEESEVSCGVIMLVKRD